MVTVNMVQYGTIWLRSAEIFVVKYFQYIWTEYIFRNGKYFQIMLLNPLNSGDFDSPRPHPRPQPRAQPRIRTSYSCLPHIETSY